MKYLKELSSIAYIMCLMGGIVILGITLVPPLLWTLHVVLKPMLNVVLKPWFQYWLGGL